MATKVLEIWKRRVNRLKMEAYAICLVYKDPRVPWYAKILIVCIIGYAFSPIDKFLNSIPIVGYIDHLILVPLGVVLGFKHMIPSEVWRECREIAMRRRRPNHWIDGPIVVFILLLFVLFGIVSTTWIMKDWNLVLGQWFRWFTRMKLILGLNAR